MCFCVNSRQEKVVNRFCILLSFFSILTVSTFAEETIVDSDVWFKNGIKAFDAKEYSTALDFFEKAEFDSDQNEKIYYNKGLSHFKLSEYDLAEEAFKKSLNANNVELDIKASYNLGHLYYTKAIVPSTDEGGFTIDEENIRLAVDYFRDVKNFSQKKNANLNKKTKQIIVDAEYNEKLIIARLKILKDKEKKEKGKKVNILKGNVKANGNAIEGATVYIKSKWDDHILAQVKTDSTGAFQIPELDMGKYQLAATLFNDARADLLNWSEPKKVPAYEKDNVDLNISGPLTLASPYNASVLPLAVPFNDSLRLSGPDSILKSTDWGELTDGKPVDYFSDTNGIDTGYVAFAEQQFQMSIAVPSKKQNQNPQKIKKTTEPAEPPTFKVTLKGFVDKETAMLPENLIIFGMKKDAKEPIPLYNTTVKTTEEGLYSWTSEEFAQQDCRVLLLGFSRISGKHIALHEIEVSEDNKQENKDQNEDKKKKKDEKDKDKKDNEDQKKKDKKKKKQDSRPVKKILGDIRKKNKDAKEKQDGTGVMLRVDKDY